MPISPRARKACASFLSFAALCCSLLAASTASALTAQTITGFAPATPVLFSGGTFTLSATGGASGNPVVFTSGTTAICTVSGSTVTKVTVGTCTLSANQAGNATYSAAPQVSKNVVINKGTQTITFAAITGKGFGVAPFTVPATASSSLVVTLTSTTTAVCTVSGSTVTIVALGTCTIAANQAGNTNYNAATQVTQSFAVAKGAQTITFAALATKTFGTTPFTISATASSGLAVAFSSTTTPVCTVSGSTVTLAAVGTCTVAANQAGNTNYNAATQVTQSFTVAKGTQTINFAALAAKTLGTAPFAVSATASSGLAVAFSSTTTGVCTVASNTVTLVSVGTCTIATNQAGNTNYNAATQVTRSFTVSTAALKTQTITGFAPATPVPFSTGGTFTLSATGGASGNAVIFTSATPTVCMVIGSTATMVAAGTCTLNANQAGNTTYSAAPQVSKNVVINKVSQTITFAALSAKGLGSAPFSIVATASSSLPVVLTSTTTGVCTVSGATVTINALGTCTITADQAGNANYNVAAQVSRSFNVVNAISTIVDVPLALGWLHTCALTASEGVKCWGYNASGQLGDGSFTGRVSPVDVVGLGTGIAAIAAGQSHTCALTNAGGVKCWGNNDFGQLGDNTTTTSTTPVDVTGLASGVVAIAAGAYHSCAITSIGGLKCWGANGYGELGTGQLGDTTGVTHIIPTDVTGLDSGVVDVRLGASHSCAVTIEGRVKCWGFNYYGQLGDGTVIREYNPGSSYPRGRYAPADVVGLTSGTKGVEAGYSHSCALSNPGGVKCWGYNNNGQLGNGTTADQLLPVDVLSLSGGTAAIATGDYASCALVLPGQVNCWGKTLGSTGTGSTSSNPTPVSMAPFSPGISYLAVGGNHACVLLIDGSIRCWGDNGYGQLGIGDTSPHSTPVTVLGFEGNGTNQTITFSVSGDKVISDSPIALTASASSGLPVTLTSTTPSVCTVSGTSLSLVALGVCTITANQAGSATYNAARQVTQSFTVSSITLSAPAPGASVSVGSRIIFTGSITGISSNIFDIKITENGIAVPADGTATINGQSATFSYGVPNASVGTHVYRVSVVTTTGSTILSSPITVTVTPVPPSLMLTAPVAGSTVNSPVTISLNAQNIPGAVTKVEFLDGSTVFATYQPAGAATSAVIDNVWANATSGSHTVTVKITNDAGATFTSNALTFTVRSGPTVSLINAGNFYLSPANVPVDVEVSAIAAVTESGTTISKVELYLGTSLASRLRQPPYKFILYSLYAGTYIVKARATDSLGSYAETAPFTITVGPSSSITIPTTLNGSTVASATLSFTGTVAAPANSSIAVNGQIATITNDGRYVINDLPLQVGANTITVTLTTPSGATTTQTFTVTRSAGASLFTLSVSPTEGTAPVLSRITLTNSSGTAFKNVVLSCDNPNGDLALAGNTVSTMLTPVDCNYTQPGVYRPWVAIRNAADQVIWSDFKFVTVGDALGNIGLVRAIYVGMVDKLKANNATGALASFSGHAKEKYAAIFAALGTGLATAAGQLGTIDSIVADNSTAEISIVRTVGTTKVSFTVHMFKGEDGVWRIESI
jgi:alpha-tubulin suppressor-like RCC1 family protein